MDSRISLTLKLLQDVLTCTSPTIILSLIEPVNECDVVPHVYIEIVQLIQAPKEPTPHLLPFMLPGVSSEQATLYRKVSKAMYGIHHNKEDATALVNIAQEW